MQKSTSLPGIFPALTRLREAPPKEERAAWPADKPTPAQSSRPGLTHAEARRMRLDKTMPPATLQLRMNRQNLLNEMRMHHGKTVSHFALMKPRPVKSPAAAKLPPMVDENLRRRVEDMLRQQEQLAENAREEAEEGVPVQPRGSTIEQCAPMERRLFGGMAEAGRKVLATQPGSKSRTSVGKADADDSEEGQVSISRRGSWTDEPEVTRVLDSRLLSSIFRSMQNKDGSGLPRERVLRCLEFMGYKCLGFGLVEESLASIPGDAPLSLSQFAKVAVAFETHRRAQFSQRFSQIDYRNTGSISVREFRSVLRDFGFSLSPLAMAQLLDEVGVSHSMVMDWEQFEAALTNVHERFGFSSSEVAEMEAAFDRYDRTGSGGLSAEELASLMGWLGHPRTIEQAQATLAVFDMDGDCVLDKLEFLLAVRQWRNEEEATVRSLFAEGDNDGDGIMTLDEVVVVLEKLGYTVLPHVIEEGIKTVKSHATGLMFEEVLHLLQRLRAQECFSEQERNDYVEVFRRFDRQGQGKLRQFELDRVLNWLGYPHTPHRRAELWVRVDVDKSGFLEEGEFFKLLRFLREEEAAAAREALARAGDRPLSEPVVQGLLHSLGYAPSEAVLHEAMAVSLDLSADRPTTLYELFSLVERVRELEVAKLRDSGGLPDHIVSKINGRFSRRFTSGRQVEPQELERLVLQLFPAVRHSREEREHLRRFIAEEGSKIGSPADLHAMVRVYAEQREERAWKREADVIAATGFSPAQVAQFREVFVKIDTNGNGYLDDEEIHQAFEEAFAKKMLRNERFLRMHARSDQRLACTDFPLFLHLIKMANA